MYSQYGLEGKDIPVMHNGAMAQKKSSEEMQKEARETLGLPANSPAFWMQKGNSKQFAHQFSVVPGSNLR